MDSYVELYIKKGRDFTTTITINSEATNLPQNTEGYIVTSALKRSLVSTNTSANLVCTLGDSNTGTIILTLDAANTSNLKVGTYFFDVKIDNGVEVSGLVEGVIFVEPTITP